MSANDDASDDGLNGWTRVANVASYVVAKHEPGEPVRVNYVLAGTLIHVYMS